MHGSIRTSRRPGALVAVATVVALAFGGAACSQAKEAVTDTALSLAEGDWTCTSTGDDDVVHLHVDGDGRFEVLAEDSGEDDDPEREEGSWTVVDQDIELSIGDTVARVIDGEGLSVDAGTITLEVPSMERDAEPGETEQLPFDVVVDGRSEVTITPVDHAADRFPSGTIGCTRD